MTTNLQTHLSAINACADAQAKKALDRKAMICAHVVAQNAQRMYKALQEIAHGSGSDSVSADVGLAKSCIAAIEDQISAALIK